MSSEVTPAAELRRGIARKVVAQLAGKGGPAASLLTGSVARGTSDEHSDIDLINYYDELPDPADFRERLAGAGAENERVLSERGPEGFTNSYLVAGIQLQTGASTVADMNERIAKFATGDVDWISAKVAAGLLEGVALHGESLIASWQAAVRAYSPELRRREIERNIAVFPVWAVDEHLAARDAELFRRQVALDGAFRVVAVLSAVNELYFTTFQFKEMRAHIARMRVAPHNLAGRLERVASAQLSIAAEELRTLVAETKAIVRDQLPDIDVDVPWRPA